MPRRREPFRRLSKIDPRKSCLVELHCFGGLTMDESAEVLKISPATAKRDWKMAKAWLRIQLRGNSGERITGEKQRKMDSSLRSRRSPGVLCKPSPSTGLMGAAIQRSDD